MVAAYPSTAVDGCARRRNNPSIIYRAVIQLWFYGVSAGCDSAPLGFLSNKAIWATAISNAKIYLDYARL